jgi:hypothetical protein
VEILKQESTIQVFVDGQLIHAYVDIGSLGKPLKRGRFGVRHFGGGDLEAVYSGMKISEVCRS